MFCLGFGIIDEKLIPLVIGCIIQIFNCLLFASDGIILFNHFIISNICMALAKVLSFIPFIILRIRSRKLNKNLIHIPKNIYIHRNTEREMMKYKYLYILLSASLFFIEGIILMFTFMLTINAWIINIIIYCFFYYLFFKIKLYKHHFLSIILIILTGIILDLSLENLQNNLRNSAHLVILRLLREIIYSFYDVINKYIMEKKFCSVYELSSFTGFFLLILLGILSLLNYYFFKLDNFIEYYNNFNTTELFVCIGFILIQFGLELCVLFTIKNNTPCHIYIISAFGILVDTFFNFSIKSIISIIFFIFILFMSLIFNEIIEINCLGLSENTRKNIMNRETKEKPRITKGFDINEENDENSNNEIQLETFKDDNYLIDI